MSSCRKVADAVGTLQLKHFLPLVLLTDDIDGQVYMYV